MKYDKVQLMTGEYRWDDPAIGAYPPDSPKIGAYRDGQIETITSGDSGTLAINNGTTTNGSHFTRYDSETFRPRRDTERWYEKEIKSDAERYRELIGVSEIDMEKSTLDEILRKLNDIVEDREDYIKEEEEDDDPLKLEIPLWAL